MKRILDGGITSFRDFEPAPSVCHACGHELDCASPLGHEHAPQPGNVSICIHCGPLAVFADERLLRKPTDQELADIHASRQWPTIAKAQQLIAERKQRGGARR
jgi:hypothetical protein